MGGTIPEPGLHFPTELIILPVLGVDHPVRGCHPQQLGEFMRGIGKIVGPIGVVFLVTGLALFGYDIFKAVPPLGIGGLLLGVALLDAFRWDGKA